MGKRGLTPRRQKLLDLLAAGPKTAHELHIALGCNNVSNAFEMLYALERERMVRGEVSEDRKARHGQRLIVWRLA